MKIFVESMALAVDGDATTLLSAREQRRISPSTRIALAVAEKVFAHSSITPAETLSVFASSGGEVAAMHGILEALATEERLVSPTQFHNSVHNTPAGYWNIATQSQRSATSIAAHDWTAGAGLLKAAMLALYEQMPVLMVIYDVPFPAPLHATRPIAFPFAAGLLITPQQTDHSVMQISLLQDEKKKNPATIFELIEAIENKTAENITLEYPEGSYLQVALSPC